MKNKFGRGVLFVLDQFLFLSLIVPSLFIYYSIVFWLLFYIVRVFPLNWLQLCFHALLHFSNFFYTIDPFPFHKEWSIRTSFPWHSLCSVTCDAVVLGMFDKVVLLEIYQSCLLSWLAITLDSIMLPALISSHGPYRRAARSMTCQREHVNTDVCPLDNHTANFDR